jgi:hypothetical protein
MIPASESRYQNDLLLENGTPRSNDPKWGLMPTKSSFGCLYEYRIMIQVQVQVQGISAALSLLLKRALTGA